MAKPELGTKRACPETGRNFYDLNKDPIVSPYTGKEYPLSFFDIESEQKKSKEEEAKVADAPEAVVEDEEEAEDIGPEIISLEEADEGADGDDDISDDDDADIIADIPNVDIDLDDDDDDSKPDDDTFLEEDDDDTDLSVVIGSHESDDSEET